MKVPASAKSVILLVAVLALALGPGCGKKKKEITSLQRKEAVTLVSEAEFALTLRDYARAEGLLAKAAELCPDTGEYWLTLAQTRMRLKQRDTAKAAYQRALGAFEDLAAEHKKESGPMVQQVAVLALMGRVDDARALLQKLPERFPEDRAVRSYIDSKALDRMIADPKFKEVAL